MVTNSNHQHIMANNLIQQVHTDVVQFLSGESVLFSNESDLQLRLSCYLKHSGHYDCVEVEYYVPFQELQRLTPSLTTANFPWETDLYIDIVVEKDGQFVPIELKYSTKEIKGAFSRFGVAVTANVPMLKNQGAQDIVRYNFWKDVRRIEALSQAYAATIVGGLAVMVTNDSSYQSNPTNPNVGYANFSIKNGRTVEQPQNHNMWWQNGVSVAKKKPNFQIDGTYTINRQPMPKMKGFSYIIL
jgi:hypothetical protein